MRVREEVSSAKLRGGFYTPSTLVESCLRQIAERLAGRSDLRMLEPAVGDGAFVRGISSSALQGRVAYVEAVDVVAEEATKARASIDALGIAGEVHVQSALAWAAAQTDEFDFAVGNPPFVRFQFIGDEDKRATAHLGTTLGIPLRGVSNLWIPILLVALASVRQGGAFAFIVPTELLTGIAAGAVRRWLGANTADLLVQLYAPGSFPGVLQEVAVLSGTRNSDEPGRFLRLEDSSITAPDAQWTHAIDLEASTWTRMLLSPDELGAFAEAERGSSVHRLGELARFEVAAVTGANEFFSVPDALVEQYELGAWARPLLPRGRLVHGLRYTASDHEAAALSGARTALLDFAASAPDPMRAGGASSYLAAGERAGLHKRYKTRIRQPWYRIPHIRPGRMMLSKRSHRYPRLILNDAQVVTTDTLYRGWMQPAFAGREEDLTAGFHNSLTLLSAEIEGRSFGGGVLELVPSEIARLVIPFAPGAGLMLDKLSQLTSRTGGEIVDGVVHETDRLLVAGGKLDPAILSRLKSALRRLQGRRLERSEPPGNQPENAA